MSVSARGSHPWQLWDHLGCQEGFLGVGGTMTFLHLPIFYIIITSNAFNLENWAQPIITTQNAHDFKNLEFLYWPNSYKR
jgi:hypothetical protein